MRKDNNRHNRGMHIGFTFLLFLAAACNKSHNQDILTPEKDEEGRIAVKFAGCPDAAGGKSSACADENSVTDLNVWCYLDGKLDAYSYSEDGNCSVRLYDNREYTILASANTGYIAPPFLESDAMDSQLNPPVFTEGTFKDALPMSTAAPVRINTGAVSGIVPLGLTRLVAKYRLRIGKQKDAVSQLEVKSVRIGNSPSCVCLFKENPARANLVGGDFTLPGKSCPETCLYLFENIHDGQLDENVCTYVEIKGRLRYEDRPSDDAVYVLDQNMTFKWYLKDSAGENFSIRRNTEYSATFTWSDFGWIADPDHITVDEITDDNSYCITFCDSNGLPVGGGVFEDLDKNSVIDLHYRVMPVSDSSFVKLSPNIQPQSIHLSFLGEPEHLHDGIFRQRIANNTDRELPAEMTLTLTNTARGISCNASIKLKGSGNCVGDWNGEDDEIVNY